MKSRILLIMLSAIVASPAQAHLGHLGEVAGHAHWLGAGVIVVGGILAAVLGSRRKDSDEPETKTDDCPEEQGEAA